MLACKLCQITRKQINFAFRHPAHDDVHAVPIGYRVNRHGEQTRRPRPTQLRPRACTMFNDMLCELPFVRVLLTQAVMFNAMLCELLFVRVILTQAALHFADAWQHPIFAEMSMPAPRIKPRRWVSDKLQKLSRRIFKTLQVIFRVLTSTLPARFLMFHFR